jgi:maltooligosyltrehalose trehalohydrolase
MSGWTMDMGAMPTPAGVRFSVWAPAAGGVEVELLDPHQLVAMQRGADDVWSALVPRARSGTRYWYRLNGRVSRPDPYSRSQPEGPHGPSAVVDPNAFRWRDQGWPGQSVQGLVIYQVHIGTATPEGTFDSFIGQLPRIKALGVTAIEPLPVAEFPGQRNWGYDGVDLFAPAHVYGGPAAMKRFVDAAHQHGLGVILDAVYNHFGPDGNYLRDFSADYFTDRYHTPWGEAINYDGPRARWVRKFVLDNARYWLHEYHVDGLRLDATHAIYDNSAQHLLSELTQVIRASLPPDRHIALTAETHENDVRYLKPVDEGGFGFDAVWADDFHHTLRRYLAGDREGYYADYVGTLDEVARCIEQGWLYEGQPTPRSGFEDKRGTPARDRPAWQFIYTLQNHDQVGNRPFGDRLNHQVDADAFRAASTLLLFLPYTPLLFMGQEYGASAPFQFFTDHTPELGKLVTQGRRTEFQAFSEFADPHRREHIPDPQAESTFLRSKLRPGEADTPPGAALQTLYATLLDLRRTDPVLAVQDRHAMEAKALRQDVLAVRRWRTITPSREGIASPSSSRTIPPPEGNTAPSSWRSAPREWKEERLLLVNFGANDARIDDFGGGWRVLLDSDSPTRPDASGVTVAPRSATVLARDSA